MTAARARVRPVWKAFEDRAIGAPDLNDEVRGRPGEARHGRLQISRLGFAAATQACGTDLG